MSALPDADREWLVRVIKASEDRLNGRIDKLERALLTAERDSKAHDLQQMEALVKLQRDAGAKAGSEAAQANGKKWSAIMAGIALLTTLAQTFLAQHQATPPPNQPTPAAQVDRRAGQ